MKKRVFIILMTTFCLAVTVQIASAQNEKMKDDKMMMAEIKKSPSQDDDGIPAKRN